MSKKLESQSVKNKDKLNASDPFGKAKEEMKGKAKKAKRKANRR